MNKDNDVLKLELKNVQLDELFAKLKDLEMRKRDLVVSADSVYVKSGKLYVRNADRDWRDEMFQVGVEMYDGGDYELKCTDFAKGTICDKLGISRTMRRELVKKDFEELWWMNVLALLRLEGTKRKDFEGVEKENGGDGILRGSENWLYEGLGLEKMEVEGVEIVRRIV